MTPSDLTADSLNGWLYAIAARRVEVLAEREGRRLTVEDVVRETDRRLAEVQSR